MQSWPSSVSREILTAQVSLTKRLPQTSGGTIPTKLILGNYVNIKSMARRFAQSRNRKSVDLERALNQRVRRSEDEGSRISALQIGIKSTSPAPSDPKSAGHRRSSADGLAK
jgi:hypothetical protein